MYNYTMNGIPLTEVQEEKDIGVIIHKSLKPSRHCAEMARKANTVLSQISRSFHFRDKKVFIQLYKQHVRSLLEFSSTSWSPWTAADIEIIEKVQKRAVRMISGLTGQTYEEKLVELNLPSLEMRRYQSDMIQTFKIIKNIDAVESSSWFNLVGENPRRHTRLTANPLNIIATRQNNEIRRNFFSQRVPDQWNNLPDEIKSSRNLKVFKSKLKHHLA